ncbi:MAG: hypothetical protein ACLPWD_01730 [Methanobacterium sp.]
MNKILISVIGLMVLLVIIWGSITLQGSHNTPVNTTKTFNNTYVSFDYPSNWNVTSDNSGNGKIQVYLTDSNDNNTFNAGFLSLLTDSTEHEQSVLYPEYANIINNNTTANGYKITWYNDSLNQQGGTVIGGFISNGSNVYWLDIKSSNSNITDTDDSQCFTLVINTIHFK